MDDQGSASSVTPPHHPAGFYFVIAVFFSLLLGVNSYLAWQHGQETLGASTEKEPLKKISIPSPLPTWPTSYPLCFRKDPTPTIPFLSVKIEPTMNELSAKCPVFLLSKYRAVKPDSIDIASDRIQIKQPGVKHTIYEQKPVYDFVASPPAKLVTKTFTTDTPADVVIDRLATKGSVLSLRTCTLAVDTSCKETEKGLLVLLSNGTWLEITGDYISTILTKNFAVDFPIDLTYVKP